MTYSINIFDQIKKLYTIYYSSDKTDFDLKEISEEDFYNMIFPHLNEIINMVKEKQKKQREEKNSNLDKINKNDINDKQDNMDELNLNSENDININMNSKKDTNINNTDNIYNNDTLNSDSNILIPVNDDKNNDGNINFQNNPKNKNSDMNYDSYVDNIIKPIIKKLYKSLSLICHPDKNKKYKDGHIFNQINECYKDNMLIGLINFSLTFDIDLQFLDLDHKMVNYLIGEMRILINKILNKNINH